MIKIKTSIALIFAIFSLSFCKGPSQTTNKPVGKASNIPIKLSVISNFFKDSIERLANNYLKLEGKEIISESEYKQLLNEGFVEIFNLKDGKLPSSEQDFKSRQSRAKPLVKNLIIRSVFSSSSDKVILDSLGFKSYEFPGQFEIATWQISEQELKGKSIPDLLKVLINEFVLRNK